MITITEQDFSPDLYFRLNIEPDANATKITQAYKSRAKETHPDKKNPDSPDDTAEFVAIGRAYEVLNNPIARDTYDQQLSLRTRTTISDDDTLTSDFKRSNLYKDYRYTDTDVQRYKDAAARINTGNYRSGDLSTVFNFCAGSPFAKPTPSSSEDEFLLE